MAEEKYHKVKVSLQENQFIVPSFSIYGGLAGFHDYGILGTKVKNKLVNLWRRFFLDNDDIEEIETPIIMPFEALEASGHVDRFTDYIVKDKDGRVFRADHLVKDYFRNNGMDDIADQVDGWSKNKLEAEINKHSMIEPPSLPNDPKNKNKKPHVKVDTKNLMYGVAATSVSNPNGIDFLRPELAQGIFLNYGICQQFLKKDLPWGLAQVGKSYRKEISPQPLVRMREFTQAEIEYFVNPLDKTHPKYNQIQDYNIPILTAKMQQKGEKLVMMTIKDAIDSEMVSHQIIGYYLARIHMFALEIGLKEEKIRFRQHLPHEMAHYASECWDLETRVNNDWLECIGCADRGSYDLQAHSKRAPMTARRKLDQPIIKKKIKISVNKKIVGDRYKEATTNIVKYFDSLEEDKLVGVQDTFSKNKDSIYIYIDDLMYVITKDMIRIDEISETTEYEDYTPHVIEPSFGIDRLMYSIFEQNFWTRPENKKRVVLSLPKHLAPYDIAIFQLHNKDEMISLAQQVKNMLHQTGLRCYTDNSGVSIGKKYVRTDEMGIKYAITVDPGSLKDNQVTIRDRDTVQQIRVDISKLVDVLNEL